MSTLKDSLQTVRCGLAYMRGQFRELRRLNTEPEDFSAVAQKAEQVPGWLRRSEGEVLYHLASHAGGGVIVEIGSYLGKSTTFLAAGAARSGTRVFAVDPHTGDRSLVDGLGLSSINTYPRFLENIRVAGVDQVVVPIVATSTDAASSWQESQDISLLFIDGWHSTDAVMQDGLAWTPFLGREGVVVFDDAGHPEITDGIQQLIRSNRLPSRQGTTGKMLIFGPHALFQSDRRLRKLVRQR